MAIRRLTPRECFRLQGWEDVYFERAALVNSRIAGRSPAVAAVWQALPAVGQQSRSDHTAAAKGGHTDSQLYKQAGNGVTVPVVRAIAERIGEDGK